MGKYDKFKPYLDKDTKSVIHEKMKDTYRLVAYAHNNPEAKNKIDTTYNFEGLQKGWAEYNVRLCDAVSFGIFSMREVLTDLGYKVETMKPQEERLLIETFGQISGGLNSAYYNLNEKEAKLDTITLNTGDNKAISDDYTIHNLTRWDNFWAFFGIETSHAKNVAVHNALIKATEERLDNLTVRAKNKDLIQNTIKKYAESNETNLKTLEDCHKSLAEMNEIFFGKDVPPDYVTADGKKISALSACMSLCSNKVKNIDLSPDNLRTMGYISSERTAVMNSVKEYRSFISQKQPNLREKFPHLDDFVYSESSVKNRDSEFMQKFFSKNIPVPTTNIIGSVTAHDLVQNYALIKTRSEFASLAGKDNPSVSDEGYRDMTDVLKNTSNSVRMYKSLKEGNLEPLIREFEDITPDSYNPNDLESMFENLEGRLTAQVDSPELEETLEI